MLRIGTSGFSYDDWIGPVYPEGLPAREHLQYYATLFSTVELNVTYYRVPAPSTVVGWVRKTPEDFLFAVKAYGELTHKRETAGLCGIRLGHPAAGRARASWAACSRNSPSHFEPRTRTGTTCAGFARVSASCRWWWSFGTESG